LESQSLSKVQLAPMARLVQTRHQHLFDSQSVFHTHAAPSSPAAGPVGGVDGGSALGALLADAVGSARGGSLLGAAEALAVGSLVGSVVGALLGSLVGAALTREEAEADAFEGPP
jgi:hypothetical protein